jgi:formamidopyrimidine-DNA glycosylase
MTGQLLIRSPMGNERAVFGFEGGPMICFVDRRRFGEVQYSRNWQQESRIAALGPEPLNGSLIPKNLKKIFRGRSASIHSMLLNQNIVAGLGNIYVTEALFRSRICPSKPAGEISLKELETLVQSIRKVLEDSIQNRGYSMTTYVDVLGKKGRSQMFTVCYGKEGKPCSFCGAPLKRKVITERGVVYCPRCQK